MLNFLSNMPNIHFSKFIKSNFSVHFFLIIIDRCFWKLAQIHVIAFQMSKIDWISHVILHSKMNELVKFLFSFFEMILINLFLYFFFHFCWEILLFKEFVDFFVFKHFASISLILLWCALVSNDHEGVFGTRESCHFRLSDIFICVDRPLNEFKEFVIILDLGEIFSQKVF